MKKILLAYDGGEPARRALETAGQLTRAFHASLSVVSVVPEGASRPPRDPSDEACLHAQADRARRGRVSGHVVAHAAATVVVAR